jgi:hypothetical protein
MVVQTTPGSGMLCGLTPHVPSQSLLNLRSVGERLNEQPAPSGISTDDHCTNPKPGPHLAPCRMSWLLLSPLHVTALFRVSRSRPSLAGEMQPAEFVSAQTATGRFGATVGAIPHAPMCATFQGSPSAAFLYCRHPGIISLVVVLVAYMPTQRVLARFAPQRSPNQYTFVPLALQPAHCSLGPAADMPASELGGMQRAACKCGKGGAAAAAAAAAC